MGHARGCNPSIRPPGARGWIEGGSERAMSSAVKRSTVMVLLGLLAWGDLLGLGIPAAHPERAATAFYRVIQVSAGCSMSSASGPDSRFLAAFRERNPPRSMMGIMSTPRPVSGRLAVIVACHRRMATWSS